MRHQNSFDLLRIILALCVIITHAYTLSGQPESNDPLFIFTNGYLSSSYAAVAGFFSVSGFLVMQSLQRSQHISDFFLKRIVRIFPGLLVLLFLTVALGWIVYPYGISQYLHNPSVYSYFSRNLLLLNQQLGIDGMFQHLPYQNVINGSLWTLPYEIVCYLILSLFFFIPARLHRHCTLFICLLCVTGYILSFSFPRLAGIPFFSLRSGNTIYYMAHFFCGAFLGTISRFVYAKRGVIALAFLVLMVLSFGDRSYFVSFQALILPPIFIALGCMNQPKWVSRILRKTGDMSYGIYIYGFVVEQVLVYFFHLGPRKLILAASIISILIGCASWKLVESRALQLVRKKPVVV